MANSTDSELAARFAAGDNACIAEVIELHQPSVVRLAARMLGGDHQLAMDDLVQEVFLRAIEKRNQFQQTSTLKTWLTSITLNQCRAYLRKQRRRKLLLGWWQNQNPSQPTGPADTRATTSESAQQVRDAIARLPTVSREIVVLHYLEELTIDEAAQALGITAGAAATRLSRARAQLRERIDPTLFHD
ncbi:RNA polymerase sigma factor [Aeoliella sp. SH292]|uniref:RNA polymerase sigma factor n=1 Tax=Aeoliella sp. SH292 TaxID=3454464 RepID=UPI003F973077